VIRFGRLRPAITGPPAGDCQGVTSAGLDGPGRMRGGVTGLPGGRAGRVGQVCALTGIWADPAGHIQLGGTAGSGLLKVSFPHTIKPYRYRQLR
jgi:hypothetical protein